MAALWTIAAIELMVLGWMVFRDILHLRNTKRAEAYRKERDRLHDDERGLNWGDAFIEMTHSLDELREQAKDSGDGDRLDQNQ